MTYKFACPHCDQHISADTDVQGAHANCPTCGGAFIAPAFVAPPPPPPPPQVISPAVDDADDDADELLDAPWRAHAATDAQKRKLKYYGIRIERGLTKGEASDLITAAMEAHPEIEDDYQAAKQLDDDIHNWYYMATESDFVTDGSIMWRPTREMVAETVAFLNETTPDWQREYGGNRFCELLLQRYPQLAK
jgi:hypothetical protein